MQSPFLHLYLFPHQLHIHPHLKTKAYLHTSFIFWEKFLTRGGAFPGPLRYLQLQLRNGKVVGEGDFVVCHSLKQLSYLTFAGVHSDAKLEAKSHMVYGGVPDSPIRYAETLAGF